MSDLVIFATFWYVGFLRTCVLCFGLLFAYIASSVLRRFFALCGLLAHIQNYVRMLALVARLRFDDLLDDSHISHF